MPHGNIWVKCNFCKVSIFWGKSRHFIFGTFVSVVLQRVMSASATGGRHCPCDECSQSCHLYLKPDEAQTIHRIKLLEQAHCAWCWKPLRVNTVWPGARWVRFEFAASLDHPLVESYWGESFYDLEWNKALLHCINLILLLWSKLCVSTDTFGAQ